ncbi:MlaC/ttg2D family ABC transporter substrate-binding protein [Oceanibacterium hippocampi]|uniref:Putative phospholipid-binding protein MlaC n=1 Tax=Oceanibacterium hippocampi TaxID=745714 RepID=A0A1Y5S4I6_9PROT|nr:ABC transporter substrate-binding protein [Oceanibacterium hippocampi]SLN32412.1 putative phospholipid-binding protein MlaC precursor [Oceanibacterium hippocampi]
MSEVSMSASSRSVAGVGGIARAARMLGAALFILVAGHAAEARSADDQAAEFVADLGREAITLLTEQERSTDERRADFDRILTSYFDLDSISRFVLGRHWRVATEAQRDEFRTLFRQFVIKAYAERLSAYSGEEFTVKGARDDNGKGYIVESRIERQNGPPVRVDWRLRERDEGLRIVDVVVEGVSMAITQRADFNAAIAAEGGKVDGLLKRLRAQTSG